MISIDLISDIQISLKKGLPGEQAQYLMAPPVRRRRFVPNTLTKQAAVLITLYPKNQNWHIVFIERANEKGHDRHRGQISLPGGKKDQVDISFEETAIRETQEEVGIIREDVQILGALSELFIPVSDFRVYPFIGYLDYTPQLIPQEEEVANILEIPLHHFLNAQIRKKMKMDLSSGLSLPNVPYFDLDGKILWGATAMIMSEFLELLPTNKPYL